MKKSIALLSVLFFMLILVGLVNGVFLIYEKYTDNNFGKIISQNSVLISDIKKILKNTDINSTDELKMLTSIPISSKDGNFRGIIDINIESNRINLNDYLKNNNINKSIDNFLSLLFEKYEVADPIFLKDLILDTLDNDTVEREGDSEIRLYDKNFPNGYINYKILQRIVNFYEKKRDDKNVKKIPWKKLFVFFKIHTPIYCDFINKEIFNLLGINETCDDVLKNSDYKNIVNDFDIISYDKNRTLIIKLRVSYILDNLEEEFDMYYDINKKRVIKIESNPLY